MKGGDKMGKKNKSNDVFSRTASQLIKLAYEHGEKTHLGTAITIQLSRQELADMVGTTRETVSRTVTRFKKEKALSESKDQIIIINENKLREWI